MGEEDYSTVAVIAGERNDIGMTASSTPTGARRTFYQMCTDKRMGYSQHYHPSTHNPNWCQDMEDTFRAELTPVQYIHEVMAEFGTEEAGVFNKTRVDNAREHLYYAYDKLTDLQKRQLDGKNYPEMLIYDKYNKAPGNVFRTMGVDFDAYQAGSSLVVLDYNVNLQKFQVIKRLEVPKGEYTLDRAVGLIIEFNEIYNPSWIFCDRGYGDYQIERLHIHGEKHPSTGLKNKVVGYQFSQTIDIIDPVTRETRKEPIKQLMVNQLCLSFERDRIILSPFDDLIHKQLIDYHVVSITRDGKPVYTSENEHFVDALGLAHLAFVLKFPNLTKAIKEIQNTTKIESSTRNIFRARENNAIRDIDAPVNPWANRPRQIGKAPGERRGDYQKWIPARKNTGRTRAVWGARGSRGQAARSMW